MPDWSYRTFLRPLLLSLPAGQGEHLALGAMGRLGRLPGGYRVIEFFGHMAPSPQLRLTHGPLTFPTRVGIGQVVDSHAIAVHALSQFGVAFVETGPVTPHACSNGGDVSVDLETETLSLPPGSNSMGVSAMVERLRHLPERHAPLIVRLAPMPGTEPHQALADLQDMMRQLAPLVDAFSLSTLTRAGWSEPDMHTVLAEAVKTVRTVLPQRALLVCLPLDVETEVLDRYRIAAADADGYLLDGRLEVPGPGSTAWHCEVGPAARERALATVSHLRQTAPAGCLIIAGGGVHEPQDALRLLEAGADLTLIDSGLVLTGPALPKRINEAVLFARTAATPEADPLWAQSPRPRPTERAWFWLLLLGLAMLVGSLLATAVGLTRVVLPYDEQFVGFTRVQLAAVNQRLLSFMTHDRVSLAGTMMSTGVLFTSLAFFGVRRGLHWAWVAVVWSALVGFCSFFLFLGFGYLDPFHAFVSCILFQLMALGMHGSQEDPQETVPPDLVNDTRWRRAQWGQLLLLAHGFALGTAGVVISGIGITSVFVPEDLEFMGTTRDALAAAGPHLLSLIAHDRATFGAMLAVAGFTFLTSTLWGFHRGRKWLWWTWLLAGLPGYAAGIGVHYLVGYVNPFHLAPAFSGLILMGVGLALSYPYLAQADPQHVENWRGHLPH